MLDIVPSCNPVQYQGKLVLQTWENGGRLILGPILTRPKLLFWGSDLVERPKSLKKNFMYPNNGQVTNLRKRFLQWVCNSIGLVIHG